VCVNPVTSIDHKSIDIGDSANLELVDKFCCLGDMLSVDGDANAAVETRIRIGLNKYRQLVQLIFGALTLLVGWQKGHPACKN